MDIDAKMHTTLVDLTDMMGVPMNVDIDAKMRTALADLNDVMGETCVMELRNVRNAYILDEPSGISKILEVVAHYNDFDIENTMVLLANPATRSRVFVSTSSSAHMVLRTFPEKGCVIISIYTCMSESGRRAMFFSIYDFLTQAFLADYDSAYLSFVEH